MIVDDETYFGYYYEVDDAFLAEYKEIQAKWKTMQDKLRKLKEDGVEKDDFTG